MGMNIQSVGAAYGSKIYSNAKKVKNESVPAKENKPVGEKVEISEQSSTREAEFQMVKAAVDNAPDVRIEVVEDIKARIKSNDYPIENKLDDITKRLIQSHVLEQ